jgi:hypothetical protein
VGIRTIRGWINACQRVKLVMQREEILKARAKERMSEGGKSKVSTSVEALRTDEKLAEMAGTSHTTVHHVRVIEREATPVAKEIV